MLKGQSGSCSVNRWGVSNVWVPFVELLLENRPAMFIIAMVLRCCTDLFANTSGTDCRVVVFSMIEGTLVSHQNQQ